VAIPLNIGRCQAHGKMLFRNRKRARLHCRRIYPGEHMSAYECDQTPGMWHFGHLPEGVANGVLDRKWISTRRIDLPE
jgi:hypothetical protein